MIIQKPFDKGWGKPHPKCPKVIDEYEEVLNKQGEKVLQKKGEIDFYEEIQARGECVEIKDIIKRYKLNIKNMPIVEIQEAIEEINNMPADWTEAQNAIARTRNTFNLLPKEEREMFNNNAEQYVKAMIEKNDKFKAFETRLNEADKKTTKVMKEETPDVNTTMKQENINIGGNE